MGRLLTDFDYYSTIQEHNLDQIIESNRQFMLDKEQVAQQEMIGYLIQRYDTSQVFTDTTVFSNSAIYKGKNLVYLDAPAYDETKTYLAGALVLQAGIVYSSIGGSAPGVFDPSQWNELGAQNSFFNVLLPETEFSLDVSYSVNDQVWYKDSVYTCQKPCKGIFPTVTEFWGTGTPYSISGVLPTDTSKWAPGDNRFPQVVQFLVDITLYHLHARINPQNIPDLRKERYDGNSQTQSGGAIAWLKRVASGDVNALLPTIQPVHGLSITYGYANDIQNGGSTISRNMIW